MDRSPQDFEEEMAGSSQATNSTRPAKSQAPGLAIGRALLGFERVAMLPKEKIVMGT
jgi:hypothetical protein